MKPLRAVGYVRVSTGEQAAGGDSLDQQADAIQRWAKYVDRHVCLFVEVASGKTMEKRPIFRDALQAAIHWKCPLVAYSMSRLARSTEDACRIRRELMQASPEAAIVMLRESIDTSTTAGKTFFGISAVIAEAERDWIAERTRDVLRFKQANGERYTKTAIYGTQWIATGSTLQLDGTSRPHFKAEPIEAEQHILEVIRLLVERGFGSTRIATLLNAAKIPYRNSRSWTRNIVRPIVERLKSRPHNSSIKTSTSHGGD